MGERVALGTRPAPRGSRWYTRPVPVTLATVVALAGLWLAAPPMGTDLSAQVARADFFASYGWAPVDFRWYGGVSPHGYSLLAPPLMGWFGPRPVGAAAAVVSALALVLLLRRTGAPRPLLGGVLGAACVVGNLVSGRVTFALGVAFGLLALLVVAGPVPTARSGRVARLAGTLLLAALAAAASPVAGLFAGLAGVALAVARPSASGGAVAAGAALGFGAAVPMAAMAGLFGTGGWMNMSTEDLVRAAGASLVVALLVPHRVVRTGALLSAAGVVAAYVLVTPVGLNATRLAVMFTLPVVAAYATVPAWVRPARVRRLRPARLPPLAWLRRPGWWLPVVLVGLVVLQPPAVYGDLARAGHPAASREYFAPLRQELARRQPAGRVEVVPTRHYWEAAHVGGVPLARGWLRQADIRYHPLFFDGTLDAASYRRWLVDNGVSYVALPEASLSWVGRAEAELVRGGLPYLTVVWEHGDWRLYQVDGAPSLVEGAAELREAAPDAVVFHAAEPGEVLVRVRWSRWLAVTGPPGACVAPAGDWTTVRVAEPGTYRLTGALTGRGPVC